MNIDGKIMNQDCQFSAKKLEKLTIVERGDKVGLLVTGRGDKVGLLVTGGGDRWR